MKVYLVKSFLLAAIHDSFLKSVHGFIRGTIIVSGSFFMVPFGIFTFLVKRHRITVQPIHVKLFSQDASPGFIYNLFPGFFIMFKQKVIDSIIH